MRAYLQELSDKEYEDKLNEIYGDVDICGIKYLAGYVLREVDPTAFRCAMADEPEIWICDDCQSQYDTEVEAEDCCRDGNTPRI